MSTSVLDPNIETEANTLDGSENLTWRQAVTEPYKYLAGAVFEQYADDIVRQLCREKGFVPVEDGGLAACLKLYKEDCDEHDKEILDSMLQTIQEGDEEIGLRETKALMKGISSVEDEDLEVILSIAQDCILYYNPVTVSEPDFIPSLEDIEADIMRVFNNIAH